MLLYYGSFMAIGLIGCTLAWRRVRAPWWIVAGYGCARLILLYMVMVVGNNISFDMTGWWDHAQRMRVGQIPFRDFSSPYGILFNFILYATTSVWNHPFSIAVFFLAFELAGLCLFRRMRIRSLSNAVTWLYVTSPMPIQFFLIDQQDEAIAVFFVALIAYLFERRRTASISFVAIVGCLFTKILSFLYFAPFFLFLSVRRALYFVGGLVGVFCVQFLCGMNPLSFRFERMTGAPDQLMALVSNTGNVWYVVKICLGGVSPFVADVLYLLIVFAFLLYAMTATACQRHVVLWTLVALSLVTQSVSRMSWVVYLMPALLPICDLIVRTARGKFWVFGSFFVVECLATWSYSVNAFARKVGFSADVARIAYSVFNIPFCLAVLVWIVRELHRHGARMKRIPCTVIAYLRGKSLNCFPLSRASALDSTTCRRIERTYLRDERTIALRDGSGETIRPSSAKREQTYDKKASCRD